MLMDRGNLTESEVRNLATIVDGRTDPEALEYLKSIVDAARLTIVSEDKKAPLTKRQRDVLILRALGFSRAKIARHLHIEESTVKNHCSMIYTRLGVNNDVEAIRIARQLGILE